MVGVGAGIWVGTGVAVVGVEFGVVCVCCVLLVLCSLVLIWYERGNFCGFL